MATSTITGGPREITKKIIVIGDVGVGKTSFVARVTEGRFISEHKTTIGVDCAVKAIKRGDNTTVRLALWDIGGQDSFRGLMTQYARGSAGIIIVCDVTRRQTIDGVRMWKNEADKVLADCPPCILLVNKWIKETLLGLAKVSITQKLNCTFDLPKHIHSVTVEELESLTESCKLSGWFQVSVKENVNLQVAIEDFCDLLLNHDTSDGQVERDTDIITATLQRQYVDKRNCCD